MPRKKVNNSSSSQDGDFPFVVLTGAHLPVDPAVRKMIRRQAMKDVAVARKQRGNYGQVNAGQMQVLPARPSRPCTIQDSPDNESDADISNTPGDSQSSSDSSECRTDAPMQALVRQSSPDMSLILSPCSKTGYDMARSRFGIDLTMLTLLTNFNVGKSTITSLAENSARLPSILSNDPQYSYLSFVPSRYDSCKVLAAATDCVLAKTSSTLTPSVEAKARVLPLYTRALKALQGAVTEVDRSNSSDLLCAVQLLSIHELLDTSRVAAWSQHIAGSAQIVKHKTPDHFSSEYDKALLAGHVGPVVSEALIMNTPCYLADPEWKKLYKSLTLQSKHLQERSELVINCRALMFGLPDIWHDVGAVMRSEKPFDISQLEVLAGRCRRLQSDLLAWLEDYKSHCVSTSLIQPTSREIGLRREVFGTAIESMIIVKRLLTTVCDAERPRLEPEVQALAQLILDLQDQPASAHSWLFAGHEVGCAEVAVATKDAFEEDLRDRSAEEQELAVRKRYVTWSGTLRGV